MTKKVKLTKSGNIWVKTKIIKARYVGLVRSPINVPKPFNRGYKVLRYDRKKDRALLKKI